MLYKQITIFLVLASVFASSFLPIFSHKAQAQWVVFDPAHTAVTTAESTRKTIFDTANKFAIIFARALVDRMVGSTINWAQTGFEGNPAYATDPKQFFTDIADGAAGEFIEGEDIGFLCSPFQASIKLSLSTSYYQEQIFSCTLTEVVGNIENFYNDFSAGGWNGWFSMTQNPTNNPYGAYLEAKIELDSRIAKKLGLEKEQLEWNKGFLSWSDCIATNPEPFDTIVGPDGIRGTRHNPRHVPGKAVGECIERGPVKTPGTTIEAQLNKVLPSGFDRLVTGTQVDQLIQAFATGLLKRYVFSERGLFDRGDVPPEVTLPPGPGEVPQCPIPTEPRSVCEGVDRDVVLALLNQFELTPEGLSYEAIAAVEAAFPPARWIEHRNRDKFDFGGGMIVDVVIGAGGANPSYGWGVDCPCGGPTTPTTPPPPPTTPPPTTPPPGVGGAYPPGPSRPPEIDQVAATSQDWLTCETASTESLREVGCHRFIREVARTLAARDAGWGLLTKNPGEHQCTMTEVGSNVGGQGYACDAISYKYSNNSVSVFDIIIGSGGTNPDYGWQNMPRRPGNNWASVP